MDFTYRDISLDSYFDKIFYINLKEDTNRNENILNEFAKFRIFNTERIEGEKIEKIPDEKLFRNFNKKDEKYILGSLGARTSHLKCVKLAKERDYKRILIVEDDVNFAEDPNILLRQRSEILNDWDLLYFAGLIEPFFRNQIVGAYAYAVKHTLFDEILNMAEASGMEIDNFYAKILQHMSYNHNQSGKYNIRIILPFNTIIVNNKFQSHIR